MLNRIITNQSYVKVGSASDGVVVVEATAADAGSGRAAGVPPPPRTQREAPPAPDLDPAQRPAAADEALPRGDPLPGALPRRQDWRRHRQGRLRHPPASPGHRRPDPHRRHRPRRRRARHRHCRRRRRRLPPGETGEGLPGGSGVAEGGGGGVCVCFGGQRFGLDVAGAAGAGEGVREDS